MGTSIFIGKGGTGKSTLALLTAKALAGEEKVLCVDLDSTNKNFRRRVLEERGLRGQVGVIALEGNSFSYGEKMKRVAGGEELFREVCRIAREEKYGSIVMDASASINGNQFVEPILHEVNTIFLVMTPLATELEALEEILSYLKERKLIGKVVAVYNKWPLTEQGMERRFLSRDEREGLKMALRIEKEYFTSQGIRTIRDVVIFRESERIKREEAHSHFTKQINELKEHAKRGWIPAYSKDRKRRWPKALVAAAIATLVAIPVEVSIEEKRALGRYGEALLASIEEDDVDTTTAFLRNTTFTRRARHGESIEGIAFWAFQHRSGFLDLEEERALEAWHGYRRKFIALNGYRKRIDVGERVIVPPYEGKMAEDYEKRLLVLEVLDDILNDAKLVSPYMRVRSYGGKKGGHPGIDLEAPLGTVVRAFRAGRVLRSGFSRSYGYHVLIEDLNDKNLRYLYAHLARKGRPKRGQIVPKGGVVGIMGSSGRSKKPHLHFEARVKAENGMWVDIDPLGEIEAEAERLAELKERTEEEKY